MNCRLPAFSNGLKGIKVDVALWKISKETIELGLLKAHSSAGFEFNINSRSSSALFDRLKLKPVKRTKTGFQRMRSMARARHEAPPWC